MVESLLHKRLVAKISKWVQRTSAEEIIILSDAADSSLTGSSPPRLEGCIPDIYAIGKKSNFIFIGEAKASQFDLESGHSEKQFETYLKHCSVKQSSMVILAVPLELINCAKSILCAIKKANNLKEVSTYVLGISDLL